MIFGKEVAHFLGDPRSATAPTWTSTASKLQNPAGANARLFRV